MANPAHKLSRRERQIMDIIYQRGSATAAEVQSALPEPPGYSGVRAMLAILVNKRLLKIETAGPRYVYHPMQPRQQAGRSAINKVVQTFFAGSVGHAVAALLDDGDTRLSPEELASLQALIEEKRRGGKMP
jgi:predicted transcriptional regulator